MIHHGDDTKTCNKRVLIPFLHFLNVSESASGDHIIVCLLMAGELIVLFTLQHDVGVHTSLNTYDCVDILTHVPTALATPLQEKEVPGCQGKLLGV